MRDDLVMLILCSPSGAGKTTLTRELLRTFPDFTFSVSHTTRQPRPTEVDGRDYHFVERENFEKLIGENAFLEWATVHDNLYGTSLAEIDRAKKNNKRGIVFDIDYQGARQIKAFYPSALGVFILPPSLDELKRRLKGRAADDELTIQRRFAKAKAEIEHYVFFDHLIVNDDLEQAQARLRSVVYAEQSRRARMALYAEELLRNGRITPSR